MLLRSTLSAVVCGVFMFGCASEPVSETDEIIENLVQAGFPAGDIMVLDGKVYVGNDAEVNLAASRELRDTADTGPEQYRTTNIVRTSSLSSSITKICINGSTFTGVFSTALDRAIANYEARNLTFAMARTPSTGCTFTMNAVIAPGVVGGSSGFPSGGLPFGTINIGSGLSTFALDTIEHVITHEIGHTLGFRHSDFFDRSISCNGAAVNEESPPSGLGAIHVPGTPTGAVVGGSIMNSCFRTVETGEFTASDGTMLTRMYGRQIARHGVSSAGYQAMFDSITSAGYRPVWVDGYEVGGSTFFNAVFEPTTVSWVARHNMTAAGFQTEFDQWTGEGLRLSQVDSYLVNGQVRYAAIFDSSPSPAWTAYHGVSQATHQATFNSLVEQGYRPVNISAVVSGGSRTFTALYDKASVGSFFTLTGLTEAAYQTQFEANVDAGRRLAYVNAFMEDGVPKLSAIWDQENTGSWVARHAQTAAQYRAEYDARVGQSSLLVRRVAGYESGGTARFASLFTSN
jgi:Dual-action HEIGH metallo-peptidase/Bacterial tandem repeat domain 1